MYGERKSLRDYHKRLVTASKNYRMPETRKSDLDKFFEECDERIKGHKK
jgi:hypothetical protein